MNKVVIKGKKIDFDKVISRNIKVIDLIENVEANMQRIIIAAKSVGQLPFNGSHKNLKNWLINNQGYDKYVAEVYQYYLDKCKI